jgi:hypothetical protein
MNIPASAPGSAAPRPSGPTGQSIPTGSSPGNWLEVLARQMQAGASAGPAPAGKATPSAAETANGAVTPSQDQTSESASAALAPSGDTASAQDAASEEELPAGTTAAQPKPRLKRLGSAEDNLDATALLLAFPFPPISQPLPSPTFSPVAGSDDSSLDTTAGSAGAPGESTEIQQPLLGNAGLAGGTGTVPLGQLLARSAPIIPPAAQAETPVNPAALAPARSAAAVTAKALPVEATAKAETASAENQPLMMLPGWEKVAEPLPPEPAISQPAAEAINAPVPPADSVEIRGTHGAQGESTMKSGHEQSEIAGWFTRGFLTRQNSPGDSRRVSAVISTGWRTKHAAGSETDAVAALSAANPAVSGAANEFSADAKEVAAPVPLATHIAEQAVQFKSSGLNSMSVVLKPDAHTEIRLEFATRDGQIEARAHVASGDLQQLGSNWTQLQDSLAQQGIRLLPLAGGDALAMGAGSQGNGTARRELPEASDSAVPALKPSALSLTAGTASNLTVRQLIKRLGLLDSWA